VGGVARQAGNRRDAEQRRGGGDPSRNLRDFASFLLLQGERDEWLAMQAGMPVYPAFFGRDTLTAGWQAAFADRGQVLDASLIRLGRLQSDRVNDWRDEQPGRIPYQVRQGPLARLNLIPFSAYYADYASPRCSSSPCRRQWRMASRGSAHPPRSQSGP